MKVLHISTYDSGGAAHAAIRLHNGLIDQGIQSHFLSLYKTRTDIPNHYSIEVFTPTFWHKILNKMGWPQTSAHKNWQSYKSIKGKYELISFPETDYQIETHDLIEKCDIINLHFVSNFINYPSFFRKVDKKIIWTLHDMNPFLGCFHYTDDLTRNPAFKTLNDACEKKKINALSNVNNLQIVAPSKWLVNESKVSNVLGKFKHHHIYYGIDSSEFIMHEKDKIRNELNLPQNKTILLFVAENINNQRKGFDMLEVMVNQLNNQFDNLHFLAVGGNRENQLEGVQYWGKVSSTSEMAKLYSSADVFLLPSRQDNLPLTMMESLTCGTPVIAFNTGGMADVLSNKKLGLLAEGISAQSFSEKVFEFLNNTSNYHNEQIRKEALSLFENNIQAIKYLNIYQN